MVRTGLMAACLVFGHRSVGAAAGAPASCGGDLSQLAAVYAADIFRVNERHAQNPKEIDERALHQLVSAKAEAALDRLLATKAAPELAGALRSAAAAALDLDRTEDFDRIRARFAAIAPDEAASLGRALSRERFLVIATGSLSEDYVSHFADVLEAVLDAYKDVFGFERWSKVPGKKLRVRLRQVDKITAPPHFAPKLPFHSEIDFPVVASGRMRSPTGDGKFLFYGLCHELGHVIAMWGDRSTEEDHHAWAHYTGVAIVEHLLSADRPAGTAPLSAETQQTLQGLRDVQWRSLKLERDRLAKEVKSPSHADRDGVLALLIQLHDAAGAGTLGAALNALEEGSKLSRINKVRYYRIADFEKAIVKECRDPAVRSQVERIVGSAR